MSKKSRKFETDETQDMDLLKEAAEPAKTAAVKVEVDDRPDMLKAYAKYVEANNRLPRNVDLVDLGYNSGNVYYAFGTLDKFRDAAKAKYPAAFASVIDPCLFTPKQFAKLEGEARKHKKFVVTTAVTGCKVDEKFLASLRKYCAVHDALLLILPASDPAAEDANGFYLDPILADDFIVFDDLALNKNLWISSIKLSAKHIDPITGLGRIGQRNGSFIFGAPKQRLKMVATSATQLPHALMTPGACTIPAYDDGKYMSKRTAYLATNDHVIGAIVVEIENSKTFHYRQVQADDNGSFADLGKLYSATAVTAYAPAAVVLGDWHSGETDPVAAASFVFGSDSVAAVTKPKIAILHDFFNGKSISHHDAENRVRRAQLADEGNISLKEELLQCAIDLNKMTELFEEVVIVVSNHDQFLSRYLADGRFIDDPINAGLASLLFHHVVEHGVNPLQYALEDVIGLKRPERVKWLNLDESYKIAGIECGAHGHLGCNGSRGSTKQLESSYGASFSGHSHTPEILREAWVVGCLSILRPAYVKGASSWMHTSGLVYESGQRQLVNDINGSWRA